ncbi:MAG: hypothetical protein MI864_05710 [Pseudomonadales bacterium]|uniref:HEAT repeat-containing protein n=1 Tax=Oleiphilus messinensis TaxID=141451 RepID=A0A1Y0I1M6_9GAMM|nr:HEAT repeat domain-containing protein [Oleiphilus messinensis]ARU54119.1 HEAT repeat-containing protein [Oleiphilus messinensis]MCG8610013.1 hypothetical protein [Pseudomonadales bacterium]
MNLLEKLKMRFSRQEGLEDLLSQSSNWDGYKRENAVRRLGMLGNPIALPDLFLRVNDWVPQVRSAAREAILRIAQAQNAEAFVHSLPQLYHLNVCGRDDHSEFIETIESFLLNDDNKQCLVGGLQDDDALVVRHCISLIIDHNLLSASEVVNKGLAHPDVIVRFKAAGFLRKLEMEQLNIALQVALNDSFMPIRREAFQLAIRNQENPSLLAKQYLFDRHPSIREIAIKFLKSNDLNVEVDYIGELSSQQVSKRRIAIWGIGALRVSEEIGKVQELLNDQFPSVRKQALTTLFQLSGEKSERDLFDGLIDESSSVCKEAARLIPKIGLALGADQLLQIVKRSSHYHTLASCVGLARRINKWERIIFIASLYNNKYEQYLTENELNGAMRLWDIEFNRSAAQPTPDQLTRLTELYHSTDMLKRNKSMSFTLKSYGVEL